MKFSSGVIDTGDNFATGVVHTGGAPSFANISAKFEMTLMSFLGTWGKMIHEKNLSKNSRYTVPLKNQPTEGDKPFGLFQLKEEGGRRGRTQIRRQQKTRGLFLHIPLREIPEQDPVV
jgi:hypothetical protein